MSGISSSLNYLLASNFSELGRTAITGVQTPPVNAAARAPFATNLKPGTPVSARYDYVVGANGALVQTNTTITTGKVDEDQENNSQRRGARGFTTQERPQSFNDLLKAKPTLEPADEVALFAAQSVEVDDVADNTPTPVVLENAAQDENGESVEVELITDQTPRAQVQNEALAQQRQLAVSGLYARNSEAVYTVAPVLQFAA